VTVEGQEVPLENDRSAFLAHALDRAEVWDFSIRGFFSSDNAARDNKLILVQPYKSGRVPVVFVHGTASSPGYWADLFNSLWGDPALRDGAQFWFFKYATGNPLAYSAADLRDALDEAVRTLDPDGNDPALRDMVVIGHSQGGLLAKMMVVDGEIGWLEKAMGQSLADMEFSETQTKLIRRGLEFEPMPWVRRVVFVSTPHHGSFLAGKWYSEVIGGLVSLPKDILDIGRNVAKREKPLPKGMRSAIPTSVDNMSPENPFLLNLLASPIAPGVATHSIISIGDADPRDAEALAKADDGVVECASQRLDGVDSEVLVPSGHSCQSHPATIHEVRRILLLHVRAAEERARWRLPVDTRGASPFPR
jgi:pimeloyl-ACP methyl ester carboxylesterase